jgi:hypothetical protein
VATRGAFGSPILQVQGVVARAEADIQNPQVLIRYETRQAMPRARFGVEIEEYLDEIIEERQ